MKTISIILAFYLTNVNAGVPVLSDVRELYKNSVSEKKSCMKLISILEPYNENNNVLLTAYKACTTMIMANHIFNPMYKLFIFNQGKKLLEKCVNADKENTEIRYLRFTIQSNSPAFLGYNNSISNDKIFLLNAVSGTKDLQLKKLIISFLISSEHLTLIEKQNTKL